MSRVRLPMKSAFPPAAGSVLSSGCPDTRVQRPVEHATWIERRARHEPAPYVTWKTVGGASREACMIRSLSKQYTLHGFLKNAYNLRASGDLRGSTVTIAYDGRGRQSPESAAMEANTSLGRPSPPEAGAYDTHRALSTEGHRGGRQ